MHYIKIKIKGYPNDYFRNTCGRCRTSFNVSIEEALDSDTFCPKCGQKFLREKVHYYCPHCDKLIFSAYKTDEKPIPTQCPHCKGEIDPKGAQPYIEK